jgi:Icc-related predicted phosphoesterase
VEQGDGKVPEYSETIADEFIRLCLERHPDAVVIPGDLTYNGERISLQELSEKLKTLQDSGIPVLVIPGNHDLMYPYARSYFGSNARKTPAISPEDFRKDCGAFGWEQAVARDSDSFSYVYALTDDVELMFLDANTPAAPGSVPDSTLAWAKKQLAWAKEDSKTVITVTHQSLLAQNKFMTKGFIISNHSNVESLLRKYGVTLNLSAHIHIQHTVTEDGLTDIATGCASVAPLRYGILNIGTDRSQWEYIPGHLEILQQEATDRFTTCMTRQIADTLTGRDIPEEDFDYMVEFMMDLNRAYFAGEITDRDVDAVRQTEGYLKWKTYGRDTSWYQYIESILS